MSSVALTTTAPVPAKPMSRTAILLGRLRRNPLALLGAGIGVALVLAALLAPLLTPYDPIRADFSSALQAPSSRHWLGTDELGRDQLTRILFGLRASLQVGLAAVALAAVIGIPIGVLAGYFRGWFDAVVSRLTEALMAFPFLIIAVGLAAILGASLTNATIAVAIAQVPAMIRVARAEALRLRGSDFVLASHASGGMTLSALRHIIPNASSALIVQATVAIPGAILSEAVLSYLGLGVQPPRPSLGVMLSSAQAFLTLAPWLAVFPGLAILLATFAFNLFGDGARDALDPRGDHS